MLRMLRMCNSSVAVERAFIPRALGARQFLESVLKLTSIIGREANLLFICDLKLLVSSKKCHF